MVFIVGKENELGQFISIVEVEEYIFGMVLFNDWLVCDIQKWEYVLFGFFLGKNFVFFVLFWIVMMEVLVFFWVVGLEQDLLVLFYLEYEGKYNYDINFLVIIEMEDGVENVVSCFNYKYMYWNMFQQLVYYIVNGCNMCIGDMLVFGIISGKDEFFYGSMLEIFWLGIKLLIFKDGSICIFINDNDIVIMCGYVE